MIGIWDAFWRGIVAAWRFRSLVLFMYAVNLVTAYLVIAPIWFKFSTMIDHTVAAEIILKTFDAGILGTIYSEIRSNFNIFRLLFTFGLFYLLLNTFFAGGILHTIIRTGVFSIKQFFIGCADYLSRFIKLLIISGLFFLTAIIVLSFVSTIFLLITRDTLTEFWPFVLFAVRVLLFVLMLSLINMIFDYAKIMTVSNEHYQMIRIVREAILFIMMSMRKTITLYGLYFLIAVILFYGYLFFNTWLEITGPGTILVYFILSQTFIFLKIFIRLCFFTGQYTFYLYSNTAMPGMTREMLDQMVADYETRIATGG